MGLLLHNLLGKTVCANPYILLSWKTGSRLKIRINSVSGVTIVCLAIIFYFQGPFPFYCSVDPKADRRSVSIVRMLYRSSRQMRAVNQSSYNLLVRVTAFTGYSLVTFVYEPLSLPAVPELNHLTTHQSVDRAHFPSHDGFPVYVHWNS